MPEILIVSSEEVKELLEPAQLRLALEKALLALASGNTDVPPRIAAVTPNGLLAAMPGFMANEQGGLLATKLVAVFPDNSDAPSHQGLIAYFDAATGTPLALLDGEIITEDRTAGCAAIAADLLARPDSEILTIVGAGAQGRAHLAAFGPLRRWSEIRVVSRSQHSAVILGALAREMFAGGITIADEFDEFEAAVRGADVIALCTHSDEGVINGSWVEAGSHVSSVGSQAELPLSLVGVGLLVVDHLGAVTTAPPAGAAEVQHLDVAEVTELGALIAGEVRGRSSSSEITVYKSTGHAVQDLAAAQLVYEQALAAGVGTLVNL